MGWLASRKKYRGRTYENCFEGKDCVEFLKVQLGISHQQAMQTSSILMERCFFHRVDFKDTFSEKAVYKFFQVSTNKKKNQIV